jgi:hypothetical protein
MPQRTDDPDAAVHGAEAIGEVAGLFDEDGNVDMRRTYHALERGYIDASKFGRLWVSTRRRIRAAFAGSAA